MDYERVYGIKRFPKVTPPFRPKPSERDYKEIGDYNVPPFNDDRRLSGLDDLETAIAIDRQESGQMFDGALLYEVLEKKPDGTVEIWEYEHEVKFELKRVRKVDKVITEACHLCGTNVAAWTRCERISDCPNCRKATSHVQCLKCEHEIESELLN
ncbi:MAG TPA: hypothetical protein VFO10_18090 [Oligoflexus sp.]|uniref:hypothetical protein n=1 Tax=Oligoflexus sp. TaxID=1971216 RepID=UPI002D7EC208|nr:hypothetical protein [Oligoflexus sp.]HET9239176.1 hypothetical protein [Oligoflexus sp.]